MKKVLLILGMLSMIVAAPNVWAFTGSVTNATASPGAPVSVSVNFASNTLAFNSGDISIEYDKNVLKIETVQLGTAITGFSIFANTGIPGKTDVSIFHTATVNAASGQLLIVNFTVLSTATAGNTNIRISAMALSSNTVEELATAVTDGTVTIANTVKLRLNVIGDGISGFINVGSSNPKIANCPIITGYFICYEYPAGTQITLSPNLMLSQTRFAFWDMTSCPGTGNCVFTLNAETRVVATFANNAQLMSPAAGAVLRDVNVAFNFDQGARVNAFRLEVQDKATGQAVYNGLETTSRTITVQDLPDSGENLEVKVYSKSTDTNQWLTPPMAYPMKAYTRYGDVNEDDQVRAVDASLAAQQSINLVTLTPKQLLKADVNGDGRVRSQDAALIAQRSINLISKFPIEP